MISTHTLSLLVGVLALSTLAFAEKEGISRKTNTFTPATEHQDEGTLDGHLPGLVIGFLSLAVFWLYTLAIIIKDEIRRHGIYNVNLTNQIKKMQDKYNYSFADKDNLEKYVAWKKAKIL